jgi:antitoxin HicB
MKTLQEYLELPYHVSLVRGEGESGKVGWSASVDELPDCTATGKSPEEAVQRLRKAMEAWISDALQRNEEIPEPRAASTASGRLLVRMPRTLHAQLARAAEHEGVSLNQFITGALSSAVTWRALPDGSSISRGTSGPGGGWRAWVRENLLLTALIANFIVVAVAGILAIGILTTAWGTDSDDDSPTTTVTQTLP